MWDKNLTKTQENVLNCHESNVSKQKNLNDPKNRLNFMTDLLNMR